jgi:hypothetical protein
MRWPRQQVCDPESTVTIAVLAVGILGGGSVGVFVADPDPEMR